MSGYQFIHIEAYSREASKQKTGGLSIKQVLAETGREPGNCPHVQNPQEPVFLLGNLEQVAEQVEAWADSMTDAKGRKLRKDAQCLLAGVISLPRDEEKHWSKFKAKAIDWLKEKYGDNLLCVVEHQDEAHPHIHFYAVPKKGQKFEALHEGKAAALSAKSQGKLKGEQNTAYISAMRAYQDNFSSKVGQAFGLARLGPGRRRLTRAQWKAEQKQAEALMAVEATAKKRHEHYKQQGLEAGKQQAQAEAQKLGAKVGAVVDGFKGSWHKPSQRVKTQAEAIKQQAKAYADRTKKDAERAVQDEKNRRRNLEAELEKKTYMVTNLEADNKRLLRELEGYRSTASNKQSNKLKR